ncbi:NmrA-like family-domain-containing protein [Apiospora arundinis]|uniref:NmrA-like family-domain-containing protein n=1 Tax=Apiospora arundinis TaxID=335852 RepID=A0ABR2JMJ6_9PEZI
MPKLLVVFGSTGQQGGALIDHVLSTPSLSSEFTIRGTTRDASKATARALKDKGVEIVEADLNDGKTLAKAVAGAHTVFGMTNFWDEGSVEVEINQGKAIADASVAAGVTQLIWSSLPNVTRMSDGEHGLAHFDSKAAVEEYIRCLDIRSTFFMPAWFMQNHLSIMPLVKSNDGSYAFQQPWPPETRIPLIDIRDTGKFLAPVLANPNKYHGKCLTCATAFHTPIEMAETWSKVLGKTVKLQQTTEADSYAVPFTEEQRKVIKDASTLMTKYEYFGPTGNADLDWTLEQLTDKPKTWEEFVCDYKSSFLQ